MRDKLETFVKGLIRKAITETRNNPDTHMDEIAKWQDHKLIELDAVFQETLATARPEKREHKAWCNYSPPNAPTKAWCDCGADGYNQAISDVMAKLGLEQS